MPVYVVTGNLGSGKTLVCVGKIRDALYAGRRVATNLDLRLELLDDRAKRGQVLRLSDHPTSVELHSLGVGNPSRDEKLNAVLVLDEAGAWLNSRGWQDKDRHAVIEWMLHARKLGWDVFLIVQDISLIDKQVRLAFCEHIVRCRRLDRFSVPFIGPLVRLIGFALRLPQVHIANVFYGIGPNSAVVERWIYRGRDLWAAYETRQIFRGDGVGMHSLLVPTVHRWLQRPRMHPFLDWLRYSRVGPFLEGWLPPIPARETVYRFFRLAEEDRNLLLSCQSSHGVGRTSSAA